MSNETYEEPCLFLEDRHEVICMLKGLRELQYKCRVSRDKDPDFQPEPGRVDVNVAMLKTIGGLIYELEIILEQFYSKGVAIKH